MTKQNGYLVTWDEMSTMDARPVDKTTAPTGNGIVTKSESITYYNWDPNYLLNYTDNQCPPYEAFVPIVSLISITFKSISVGGVDCFIDNNGTHYNGVNEWFMGWDNTLVSGAIQAQDGTEVIYAREGVQFSTKSYVDGQYSSWGNYTGCTTTVEVYEDNILIASNSKYFTNESRPSAGNWRIDTDVVNFTPIYGKIYEIRTYNHNLQGPPDCEFIPSFENVILQTELQECLGSLEFTFQYIERQGPCAALHNCNDATFYLRGNQITIGTVYLSNTGGSNDQFNYPPGQTSGPNRYNILTLTTQQAQDIATAAAAAQSGTITFDLVCALRTPCHSNVTWVTLKRNGTIIYNGCPNNNFLRIDPCTGVIS